MYRCYVCKKDFSRKFVVISSSKSNLYECKECSADRKRMYKYGINPEQYQELVNKSSGKCDLCGKKVANKRLQIDHDHSTGEIRGLLCIDCNTSLGKLGDNIKGIYSALEYLKGDKKCQNIDTCTTYYKTAEQLEESIDLQSIYKTVERLGRELQM